jgi:hypothetical protein
MCDITYCLYVITLPLRNYTVTDSCVELLNVVLFFGICLSNIRIGSLNDFICLVHHICVAIKYHVPYIRVSPKGSSPKRIFPEGIVPKGGFTQI